MTPKLGYDFDNAVCAHFGLPPGQVEVGIKVNTKQDEIFSVTLNIALTPDDLRKIAEHMERGKP
jgi:hypothetical protein